MYTSNGNANTTFSDFDTNPSSRIQDLYSSSYLFHLPSPLIHYEDEAVFLQQIHDILHQNDQDVVEANETIVIPNMADCTRNGVNKKNLLNGDNNQQIPRKRSYKKDRHSKINTAHGPRDRRMRLSLDVARKFFGLQDMLGFDKASKTVEWLLTKSKIAIKEVTRGFPQMEHSSSIVSNSGASSTSEWEVLSDEPEIATKTVMTSTCPKEKKVKGVRKATFHPVAKESREKKRERARERTREKNKRQLGDQSKHYCTKAANLGSWSPFENGEESVGNKNNPPSFEVQGIPNPREQRQQTQGTREGTVGDSLFVNGNWSPSPFYNYQHNSGISDEHQFTDFQFYGKLWEG